MTPRLQHAPSADFTASFEMSVLQILPHAVLLFRHGEAQPFWRNDSSHSLPPIFPLSLAESLRQTAETLRPCVLYHYVWEGQVFPQVDVFPCGGDAVAVVVASAASTRFGVAETGNLSQVARVLAHELKNPLAGIKVAGQLLQRQHESGRSAELSALIVNESGRMSRLIDKLAVFEKEPDMRDWRPLNIHAPIEQALTTFLLKYEGKIEITRDFDPSLPDIAGEHDAFVQVFANLLNNAAEAGCTALTLRTRYDTAAPPVHGADQRALPICLSVIDNGCGVDEDEQQKIFHMFHTSKPEGQGLGLAIVRKIVEDHGGLVRVVSVPGDTRFTLSFPVKRGVTT